MANREHLKRLTDGVHSWNSWRAAERDVLPSLSGADLSQRNLTGANLVSAELVQVDLTGADLTHADLSKANAYGMRLIGANLTEARLFRANLSHADLSGAVLVRTVLERVNLLEANLTGADLRGADLSRASMVKTNVSGSCLRDAHVYGISAWSLEGTPGDQHDLVITPANEATVTVDNLSIAEFVYLLLSNPEIRDVIDTVARKAVLILGRFTIERKAVLDALRAALRANGYAPILFDFEKPAARDTTETVRVLAHLARFIVADLTDPASIPQELQAIVPDLAVPVVPILCGTEPWAMFSDLRRKYHWVLDVYNYEDQAALLVNLDSAVIEPAELKARELSG